MRAALKAQAQRARGEAGQAERRTQGHGPHEGVALERAQARFGAGTGVDRGRREEERPGDDEDPYRGLEPFRLNSAALRILDGERGSSDDEASIASEARAAADRLDETLAASPA